MSAALPQTAVVALYARRWRTSFDFWIYLVVVRSNDLEHEVLLEHEDGGPLEAVRFRRVGTTAPMGAGEVEHLEAVAIAAVIL